MLRLLQAFRFADNDSEHIRRLLHWAEFPEGARLADLGAGTGYVAQHIAQLRPDISICLIDSNGDALKQAGEQFVRHCADICQIPETDGSFDAAICCYAIGYVDAVTFFRELRRLLKPGGVAFIVDMVPRDAGEREVSLFGYSIFVRERLEQSATAAGMTLDFYLEPHDPSGGDATGIPGFSTMFADVSPAIWRFRA